MVRHLAFPRGHVNWKRAHIAWGVSKPPIMPHVYLLDRPEMQQGLGLIGNWPTVDSYVYPSVDYWIAGKSYSGVRWYRQRGWAARRVSSGGMEHIPAETIASALLTMPHDMWLDVTLENFVSLSVYLAPNGGAPNAEATYDVSALHLLGAITQAACLPDAVITLDVAVLNAHHGEDFAVVFATSVEAASGGIEPFFEHASVAAWTWDVPWVAPFATLIH